MSYLSLWLLSALLTLTFILLVIYIFPKIWLLDNPAKYWFDRKPVPYAAWVIIPIVFFAVSFFIFPITKPFIWFFISSLILVIVSFIDDIKNINPYIRLWVQWLCALIIIYSWIWINEILNPFWWEIDLTSSKFEIFNGTFYLIADSLVFFWIIWMINSMNWIDWISWNASGVSAIAWWILFFLAKSSVVWQFDMSQLFLIFASICTVFFFFDLDKPRILMWDSGSMFLGFSLAVFSVIAWWKIATTLMLMVIPLFDAFFTIFRRFKEGRSLLKWDSKHFHHILLEKGLSRKSSVFLYIWTCLMFWLPALFFDTTGKFACLILAVLIVLVAEMRMRS